MGEILSGCNKKESILKRWGDGAVTSSFFPAARVPVELI
jgi:hypothetical protein